jgi:hypothetical protein
MDGASGVCAGPNAGKIARSIDCSIVGSIVGTWRLAMTRAHDDAGKPMHAPYGPVPMGVLVFSADGRMVAVLCDARPELPAGEEEREYSSYCGNYSFDGTTLVTRVDAAADRSRLGGDQVRRVRYRGRPSGADAAAAALARRHAASGDVLRADRVMPRGPGIRRHTGRRSAMPAFGLTPLIRAPDLQCGGRRRSSKRRITGRSCS